MLLLPEQKFFYLDAVDTLDLVSLCCGRLSLHCGMFSSMPGAPPPSHNITECLHTLPNAPCGLHHCWLRTAALDNRDKLKASFKIAFYFYMEGHLQCTLTNANLKSQVQGRRCMSVCVYVRMCTCACTQPSISVLL